jgi:hypothetical protein
VEASRFWCFTKAALVSELPAAQKQEVVGALSTIADEAIKKPEERSTGTIKAIVAWIPIVIGTAGSLVTLWQAFGSSIKAFSDFRRPKWKIYLISRGCQRSDFAGSSRTSTVPIIFGRERWQLGEERKRSEARRAAKRDYSEQQYCQSQPALSGRGN